MAMHPNRQPSSHLIVPAIVKKVALAIVLAGLIVLLRVVYDAAVGSLPMKVFDTPQTTWVLGLCALGLELPIPFHMISIGLIIQRRWLRPPWDRISWFAIVISGFWLGAALAAKSILSI
jgi:hypothetical protein